MVLTATFAISPIAASSLLSEVAQALAQDQNSLRIKKLLLFACTQIWENDPQRLSQLDLPNLLHQLLVIAPTLEQLQSRIHTIASSLNKSAEYTLVANAIINRVSKLYLATSPLTQSATQPKTYETVAQVLDCESSSLRIKKLLLLTCRNIWETDTHKLNLMNLSDLVRDVHRLSPTPDSLKSVLNHLVKTLSKPTEYGAIADRICMAFQPLYATKEASAAIGAQEEAELTMLMTMADRRIALNARETSDTPGFSHQTPPTPSSEFGYLLHQDLSDLFDVRLEIIQSANPLLAKIVLFSLLHEVFESGADHDLLLKNHELDDLLRILLQTHKLFSDLESKLLRAAKTLGDSGEHVRVAQVILQSVKSCYAYLPLKGSMAIADRDENAIDNATNIVSVEASLPGTTGPGSTLRSE
jgi:hypothetical protein